MSRTMNKVQPRTGTCAGHSLHYLGGYDLVAIGGDKVGISLPACQVGNQFRTGQQVYRILVPLG